MQCLFVYNYISHPPDNRLLLSLSLYIYIHFLTCIIPTPDSTTSILVSDMEVWLHRIHAAHLRLPVIQMSLAYTWFFHQQWHSGTTLMHVPLTLSLAQLSLVNSWFWPSALLPIYSTPFPPYRMLQSAMDSWFSTSSSLLLPVWSSCFSLPLDASRAALVWTAIQWHIHMCTCSILLIGPKTNTLEYTS